MGVRGRGARDNGRLVLGGLLVLGAACAAASARQNFIASGALADFWGPLLLTGAGLALAFRHVARAASSGPVEVEPSAGTPRRFGLLALAYVFIVWALAGQMLPWAYTTAAGIPHARTVRGAARRRPGVSGKVPPEDGEGHVPRQDLRAWRCGQGAGEPGRAAAARPQVRARRHAGAGRGRGLRRRYARAAEQRQ